MIDWSYVGWSALWILGLSVELSVISIAIYRSSERKLKLREILWEKGFRTCLDLGMVLFSLGLFGLAWSGENRFAEAVRRAAGFILRWRYADGSFPQVVYPSGRVNRLLQWVAAVGDMLRTLELTRNLGVEFNAGPSLRWLLAGRCPDGAFRTALGFSRATPCGRPDDPRHGLSVVGWNDKAFSYLTGLLLDQPGTGDP